MDEDGVTARPRSGRGRRRVGAKPLRARERALEMSDDREMLRQWTGAMRDCLAEKRRPTPAELEVLQAAGVRGAVARLTLSETTRIVQDVADRLWTVFAEGATAKASDDFTEGLIREAMVAARPNWELVVDDLIRAASKGYLFAVAMRQRKETGRVDDEVARQLLALDEAVPPPGEPGDHPLSA